LDEIAASVHLSKFHFQRLFKEWAGVTPTQFNHFLTIEYAKRILRKQQSILNASMQAGLSSASRLHDLFITFEAITPGEYKNFGESLTIRFGFHPTPFGECLLATTKRGICALYFANPLNRDQLLNELKTEWPLAKFNEKQQITRKYVQQIFSVENNNNEKRFHVFLKGTNFQVQVWRALLSIPTGELTTYKNIAVKIHKERAVRAVGNAVAKNPIAYLIPCHRVIRKTGKFHNYRWDPTRKQAIIGWEASKVHK
jgi:AraC family transcriptional regulator of adaptative response/methylated-DNA-[protein]-cysteine methyltransferase